MTKISNKDVYIVDTDVSDLDSVIGTDGNTTAKTTKNFLMGKLKAYFKSGLSPLTGGTLRYTEITYTGGLYATVEAMVNALDPFFTIDQYHIVVVNLNGIKSILKLQDRQVGLDKTPVVATDFITMSYFAQVQTDWDSTSGMSQILHKPNITTPDLDTVLGVGRITNKEISFSAFGATGNINNYQLQFTDNANKSTTIQSNGLVSRDEPQNSTIFQLPVNPLNNVLFKTPLKTTGTYIVATNDQIIAYDGSETKINQGTNITITGAGTIASPYVINSISFNNLQRDASASFTLADSDNNYVIQLKNTTNIVITIPDTLTIAKFECGFIRKGTGEVSYVGSGTATITNPVGFRINAVGDPAFLERDNASQSFALLGNTKV